MHSDHREYFKFTTKSRLDKSINTLLGIVEGIAIDSEINHAELSFLNTWLDEHREVSETHPFSELMPVVQEIISDGIITDEEKKDILWLCEKLQSSDFADCVAADMQRLHAILGGIAADNKITETELRGLSDWLDEHGYLSTRWPYDEVASLVSGVLRDGKISPPEHQILLGFFREFTAILDDRTIRRPIYSEDGQLTGLCSVQPHVVFEGSRFCFTGASDRYTRAEFTELVVKRGGVVLSNVSQKLHYLVVGSAGNPCWMYACYGRKVERAVELRKEGFRIVIVHENDFHDAVADY